ncbi:MAG: hypothetical protein B7Z37_30475 [Verrucomicrobia bacterium 12-59-8]|nr:MAG: hypothetical protein B7Z37_30475 [Verrucomicrobia bacterium 12-59-8]
MLTDYHTHTPLCLHAEGNPVDYARHAQSIGLAEIGLSDHNPMPEKYDDWRMLISDLPRYFELVNEAREALPDFPIRLALECDHIEGYQKWIDETAGMADWDYLIGSVHYIHDGIAVDDPKHVSRWKTASDIKHMYYEPVIQALVDTNGILEVSTAGLRKDVREIYPAREMLEMAFAAKVPIVINSDAHLPTDVGVDFNKALDLVRSVGYATTVRFEKRKRQIVPLPEACPL